MEFIIDTVNLEEIKEHVFYNLVRCLVMLPFVDPMARFCKTIIRDEPELVEVTRLDPY